MADEPAASSDLQSSDTGAAAITSDGGAHQNTSLHHLPYEVDIEAPRVVLGEPNDGADAPGSAGDSNSPATNQQPPAPPFCCPPIVADANFKRLIARAEELPIVAGHLLPLARGVEFERLMHGVDLGRLRSLLAQLQAALTKSSGPRQFCEHSLPLVRSWYALRPGGAQDDFLSRLDFLIHRRPNTPATPAFDALVELAEPFLTAVALTVDSFRAQAAERQQRAFAAASIGWPTAYAIVHALVSLQTQLARTSDE